MASRPSNFPLDAADPRGQVVWWAQVLEDFVPASEDNEDEAEVPGPAG